VDSLNSRINVKSVRKYKGSYLYDPFFVLYKGKYMEEQEPQVGIKFDIGKPDYSLLPPFALEEVVKVLSVGAVKYAKGNWKIVPDGPDRYFSAAQRHMWAFRRGEQFDPETGLHHLAHGICCLMFGYELDTNLALQKE
jgi:hypothetical protein